MNLLPRICALALLAMLVGCHSQSKAPAKAPRAPVAATPRDATSAEPSTLEKAGGCDARLHDISGLFLMYSLVNHRLPETLDDLKTIPGGGDVPDFTCPVSKQPYVYTREGIPVPSGAGRVILYDATPAHSGMRLCIVISETGQGAARVTKVIALPETFNRRERLYCFTGNR